MELGDSLAVPLIGKAPVLAASGKEKAATNLLLVHLATISTDVAFTVSTILVKRSVSDQHVNTVVFSVYRDVLACLFLVPLAYFLERKTQPPVTWKIAGFFVACAFTGVFAGQLLCLMGLSLAIPADYALTTTLIPMFVFGIAMTFGTESLEWRRKDGWFKIFGFALSALGMISIYCFKGPPALRPLRGSNLGNPSLGLSPNGEGVLLTALGALSLGIYANMKVPLLRLYPCPFSIGAYAYIIGAIMLGTTALLTIPPSEWIVTEPYDILAILYQGSILSTLTMGLGTWTTQKAGPLINASYFPLQTVLTTFASYLFLSNTIFVNQIIGGLLAISGLWSLTYGKLITAKLDSMNQDVPPLLAESSKV
ncbi:hypothetical protein MPTK1_8g03610 [Marchantia polymorpha subsp. ruderalis]|uniref:WAT1-related protein n=2 Tax=Marchantia polymorpha TaxID=3197 RepID=A0A176WU76_MARPO|nr:hypothetical protein AXG93_4225s1360 [Marchantia polymorpha subsp. ruderalis]PTQ46223.1 hypothetical protein MARPO_0012s0151 [Marchantia polymorpha]BBN18576.1 hypothetical protein Mp_8g03610 [Marchantia polymorpha subsp. ruderalis]|eukprot:PTQ46223.1 hypothetical protein MARPO_0012s0151 [Marchantia polymorpha]